MRDDPYPARFYGRQTDEPFAGSADLPLAPSTYRPTTHRLLFMLLTMYLIMAIIFMVTASG